MGGEELPYTAYGTKKFPLGQILRQSIKLRDVSMYDLYLPLVKNPNPDAVIQVEKITGPILNNLGLIEPSVRHG